MNHPKMSSGKKSFVCSVCHCKHQSARGQHCKQIKHSLPIFTTYVREFDASRETSFARNVDETLDSVFAIRRIMAFMHSHTDVFSAWSRENPSVELGLESTVISNEFRRAAPLCPPPAPPRATDSFLPEPDEVATPPAVLPKQCASMSPHALGEKGPAPPTLTYEFLSRSPKLSKIAIPIKEA
jgi:hypothetical protein